MTLLFSYKSIYKSFGDEPLFTGLDININKNERLGLIGGNGSGKSTLLKLIANIDTPEEGERSLQNLANLVYIPQEDEFDPEETVTQTLFNALSKGNMEEQEQYRIVKRMIGTGGFSDENQKCNELSGGWRKRLAITRAIAQNPDLLLLDEPTNHLDINGIIWLENLLLNADFAFVVVSHDRCFLENVSHKIMELGRCYREGYLSINGGYVKFKKHRENFLQEQQKQEQSLSNKMRRETEWLNRGAKARSTKARYRIDQAEELRIELAALKRRNRQTNRVDINFNASSRKTKKLLICDNIGKSIENRTLFKNVNLELLPGTRLGLMGENGSGKTTFMNLLEEKIQPDTGEIKKADKLRIAVFDQNRSGIDPEITLKEALSPAGDSVVYKERSIHVVSWAKRFLFTPDQLVQPVKRLSGGEKARILIANLMLKPADVLLLDEPTNDLDIPSLEVLEQSLLEFAGAVVLVSHDRFLLDSVTNSILYLDGKGKTEIFADYTQCLEKKKRNNKEKKEKKEKIVKPSPKNSERTNSKKIQFSYKDKFELEQIEEKILSAETEADELETKTTDSKITSNPEKMNKLYIQLTLAQENVEKLYSRWEELEELKASST
ncbi:MAG: ABC-F family ATP-binding cassette domain-containing protein [Thermodesulfobacteriota bacterium]|nr:ABC-F family ATP-binding cassette domain-containing protein [Thermodesulfobacteriota bacterium]